MTAIRLVIADDQAAVRDALAVMLDLDPGIDVVAAVRSGEEAVAASEHAPDVVLMDLNMPGMGGVEATKALLAAHSGLPIVVLTTFDDDQSILAALRAGARGYLTKDAGREPIVQAVYSAHAGHSVLDPAVQARLLDLTARTPAEPETPVALTAREREVLDLVGQGLRNPEIARKLVISEATVKTHINNLFAKADLHSRADAVRLALTLGREDPA